MRVIVVFKKVSKISMKSNKKNALKKSNENVKSPNRKNIKYIQNHARIVISRRYWNTNLTTNFSFFAGAAQGSVNNSPIIENGGYISGTSVQKVDVEPITFSTQPNVELVDQRENIVNNDQVITQFSADISWKILRILVEPNLPKLSNWLTSKKVVK